jgi:hypothetical protein
VTARLVKLPGRPANRILLLGASNLTLSLRTVIGQAQQRCGGPSDVQVAAGHGRSYGTASRVLIRGLPGITCCAFWSRLEAVEHLPTYALLTDIGNDIPYGVDPRRLLSWVNWCIDRMQDHSAQIVMTNLQIATIESLSEAHYRIVRSVFFPFCRLSLRDVIERASIVHQGLADIARDRRVILVESEPEWFGPDAIHVLPWKRKAFYSRVCGRLQTADQHSLDGSEPGRTPLAWLRRPRFEQMTLLSRQRRQHQPSGRLSDGSLVSLY